MSHPHPRSRGFTLIELLVVLAILGIASFAVMTFGYSKQPGAVRATAYELYGVLREAQTMARSSGRNVYLRTTGTGPDVAIEYGVFPLAADGTDDTSKDMEVRGRLQVQRQHARFARIDSEKTDFDAAKPKVDLVTEAVGGENYVPSAALPMVPSDPTAAEALFFTPTGASNRAFYTAVVGLRGDVPYMTAPMVVISVVPETGIRGYYCGDASTGVWRRI